MNVGAFRLPRVWRFAQAALETKQVWSAELVPFRAFSFVVPKQLELQGTGVCGLPLASSVQSCPPGTQAPQLPARVREVTLEQVPHGLLASVFLSGKWLTAGAGRVRGVSAGRARCALPLY